MDRIYNMIIISLITILPICVSCQLDNNWIIQYADTTNKILEYSQFPPLIKDFNLPLKFNYYPLYASDESGELLFYSDGIRIHNRDGNIIENGDSLNFDNSFN